ncbi:hypothetical protein P691DRAFT_812959 [Macrolepiota fuliginosa MF-IS2]|uniref:ABC1 atypical kinase-like domain-containing protein n=1 Tax=Macrolepiota fuliginosa MF-IS2 TaxID=1400762 RepID=A0A9P5XG27_9AGAR|nr:hypothetical protein P691DRAFT_812959 [Macrolepiota fuliginosa MF-IS2]
MEHVEGVSVGEAQRLELSQQDRDDIAMRIIELCLKGLFEFRAMRTDPNWTNFLWNLKMRQECPTLNMVNPNSLHHNTSRTGRPRRNADIHKRVHG